MKTQSRCLAAGLAVLLALAAGLQPASAWNDRGHMSVGYIAYKRLRLATRDRVNTLLQLNSKYHAWAAKVDQHMPKATPDDKNLMIFMLATTWADEI